MAHDQAIIMQLIIGYTCVGVFVATAIITILHVAGFIKIKEGYANRLFLVLVVEIVIIGVSVFKGFITVDTSPVKTQLEAGKVAEKDLNLANQTLTTIETTTTATSPTAAVTLKPRIYVHVSNKNQMAAAVAAQNAMQAAGNLVPGIQNVGAKSPSKTELRYFLEADGDLAKQIAATLQSAGVNAEARFVPGYSNSDIRPRHFELWFQKL